MQMSKFRFTFNILAVAIFTLTVVSMAQAQATRTWVSGVGDDVNPCSRTAPCKTYAGAISKTAVNGEISTLDPGGFGAVTITKSITIEGTEGQGYGSILNSATTGVSIPFDNFTAVGETQKTVRLRNLNINGANTGLRGVNITGGNPGSNNSEVIIEDCVIDGQNGSPGRGISDARAGTGLKLFVLNTTIRNCLGAGITASPAAGGDLKVSLNEVSVLNCAFGVAFGNNTKVTVIRSNFTGNSTGVSADSASGTCEVNIDQSIVSNNTTGFSASTANTIIRVSNTTAMNNGTLATTAGGGQVLSYGNNQSGGTAFPGSVGQN
jgi:hypothetical protein